MTTPTEKTVTIDEAKDILHISKPSIYVLIKRGELHPLKKKIGKRVYFDRKEVETLANTPAQPATPPTTSRRK